MSLVSPQKISESMDATWVFHKRIGNTYQFCHISQTLEPINIQWSEKNIKNNDKKLDNHVIIMQKTPLDLELK
jgi:hypothetical protein